MRTYASFLLFEDLLDNLPAGAPLLTQMAKALISPRVNLVSEDCGTLLGTVEETTFSLEGKVELSTDLPLTRTRIEQILSQGKYKTAIRNLHSCTAPGGICKKCFEATYSTYTGELVVGQPVTVPSSLNYQSDVIVADGVNTSYSLTQTDDDFYSVIVVHDGQVIPPSEYTLGYDFIEFGPSLSMAVNTVYVVHFYIENSEPLLGYIAKTYTGGLLGMTPLPALRTPIRESLYQTLISDSMLLNMASQLKPFRPLIPTTYMDYMERIHDRLEKALFILYLFAVFGNVNSDG